MLIEARLGANQESVIFAGRGQGVDLGRYTIMDSNQPKSAPPNPAGPLLSGKTNSDICSSNLGSLPSSFILEAAEFT